MNEHAASGANQVHSNARIALVLVAAVGENGIIGSKGGLPWKLKSDLKYFRAVTLNKPLIMGRKTYLAIGKPLDKRTNIVVTRDPARYRRYFPNLSVIAPDTHP